MGVSSERIAGAFMDLVMIDSPSLEEREVMDRIRSICESMGLDVYEDDTGTKINGDSGNLIVRMKGNKEAPAVLLMAHADTVPPCRKIKPVRDGDIITSDGTTVLGADDKAGVAVILETLRVLDEDSIAHGEIEAVFTVGEEIRLLGSKNLDYSGLKAKYGFVLDSNGSIGTYVKKAPFHNNISFTVKGKSAHAGIEPEKGISAIKIAADAITRIPFGRIDGETTTNIGVIIGGKATNVVTEEVFVKGEARSRNRARLDEVTDRIKTAFEETARAHGGECQTRIDLEYSGYSVDPGSEIVSILTAAAGECGITLQPEESGGGSDVNNVITAGIETVDLGIGMNNVHSVSENIKISDMAKAAEFMIEIIKAVEKGSVR